jgi:hypothetical protein
MLERLFGEERRRTKVIPHAFGERAVLKLMYAALIRAAERWRGLRMTEFETPPTDRDPQRAQSRSRRANCADRKRKCHRIHNSFIQHESDLTESGVGQLVISAAPHAMALVTSPELLSAAECGHRQPPYPPTMQARCSGLA